MRYKIGPATWSQNDPRLADIMSAPVRASLNRHSGGYDDSPIHRTEDDDGDKKQQNVPDGLASVRGKA